MGLLKVERVKKKSGFEVDETNQDLADWGHWMERCWNEFGRLFSRENWWKLIHCVLGFVCFVNLLRWIPNWENGPTDSTKLAGARQKEERLVNKEIHEIPRFRWFFWGIVLTTLYSRDSLHYTYIYIYNMAHLRWEFLSWEEFCSCELSTLPKIGGLGCVLLFQPSRRERIQHLVVVVVVVVVVFFLEVGWLRRTCGQNGAPFQNPDYSCLKTNQSLSDPLNSLRICLSLREHFQDNIFLP